MKKNRTYGLMENIGLLKMIKIMRFTIFILFLSLSQAFAVDSYSQQTKLSLDLKNAKVEDVLDKIEKSSEFFFMYNKGMVDVERKIDIQVEGKGINQILDKVFENTGITYSIKDRQILLINNSMLSNGAENTTQQQTAVSGKVTDSSGASLPGVSVVVKGTTTGIITDASGNYSLSNIPNSAILQFSFVGMKTQEIAIENQTTINVVLEEEIIGIEEVVAIGYGTTKKSDLTGAVTMVKSEELSYKTTANVAQALQGKVAGLQVTNGGAPGSSPIVQIRGLGSVRSDTQPLYVVDGILTNNISFLSNNDIESVTVLKDASASAIYGVRAANGVIIITLKHGKKDKISINYSGYTGYQVPVDVMKMANAQEYIQLLNEKGEITASKTGGSFTPYDPSKYNVSTDWFNEILRDKAFTTSHDVGFSGGNEKTI